MLTGTWACIWEGGWLYLGGFKFLLTGTWACIWEGGLYLGGFKFL